MQFLWRKAHHWKLHGMHSYAYSSPSFPYSLTRWTGCICTFGHVGYVIPANLWISDVCIGFCCRKGVASLFPHIWNAVFSDLHLYVWNSQTVWHPLVLVFRDRASIGRNVPDHWLAGCCHCRWTMVWQIQAWSYIWHLEQSHIHWKYIGIVSSWLLCWTRLVRYSCACVS